MGYVETLGSTSPDRLIAGQFPQVLEAAQIAPSQVLKRGTVLGRITENGYCVAVNSAAVDGSKDIFAVLAEDITTDASALYAEVYLTGEFNINALFFGGSDTAATHKDNARKLCIFFRDSVKATQ
jgi:hypothetical protein